MPASAKYRSRLLDRFFRTIPDQQKFTACKCGRAGGHNGVLGAYPEAIREHKPRASLLLAGATLLQVGLQASSQLAAARHSFQAFAAYQHGTGPLQLQRAKRGFVRHDLQEHAATTSDHTASACIDTATSGSVAAITAAGGVCFGNERHCRAPASLLMAEIEFPVLRMMSASCASVSFKRFLTTLTCTRSRTSRAFRERFLRRIIMWLSCLVGEGHGKRALHRLTVTGDCPAPREIPS